MQPIHLISQRRRTCRPCAACGLTLDTPVSSFPTTNKHLSSPFSPPWVLVPPHHFQRARLSGLWSLCPLLAVHLLAQLALQLSFRVPPEGSPSSWARYRGAFFPVPSFHFPNRVFYGSSSVYFPCSPQALYPTGYPVNNHTQHVLHSSPSRGNMSKASPSGNPSAHAPCDWGSYGRRGKMRARGVGGSPDRSKGEDRLGWQRG